VNFYSALNIISFIFSIYTFLFFIFYFSYAFKCLNSLQADASLFNTYLENYFEEFTFDTRYRNINLKFLEKNGTMVTFVCKNYHFVSTFKKLLLIVLYFIFD
jgi:hypothetical protein